MSIRRIRLAVSEGRYSYSVHALEEMDDDGLHESDVREVMIRGRIVSTLTGDPEEHGSWFEGALLPNKSTSRLFADFSRREFSV